MTTNISNLVDPSGPYIAPDKPSQCTWNKYYRLDVGAKQSIDPHFHQPLKCEKKILSSVLEQIGNTPIVRLTNIAKHYGVQCELLAKCEYFNAGGSVKDRIGLRMIEDAERDGLIEPGWTIIEPTSGNTGIGLALAAAVKGYKCIIVMPEKMSNEKVNVLRALGAEIIRTPTSARFDAANSHIRVAQKLQSQIPNAIILDQYRNPGNPLAHYDRTGAEIVHQTDGRLDAIVLGAGTGGTLTGIGRRIKECVPDCQIIGVDPIGSILAEPDSLNRSDTEFYEVEGIGYDFIPTVLDRSIVNQWIKMDDKESLEMARNLIRLEGILCGGSSGTAVAAAVRYAKGLPADKRVVVLLPDGVRNYMTKFLDNDWMEDRDFNYPARKDPTSAPNYYSQSVKSIIQGITVKTISETEKCIDAIRMMKIYGFDQLPVVNHHNQLVGMVTVDQIMLKTSAGLASLNDPVGNVSLTKFPVVNCKESIGTLVKQLRMNPYVAIVDQNQISGIVTHIDILEFISNHN